VKLNFFIVKLFELKIKNWKNSKKQKLNFFKKSLIFRYLNLFKLNKIRVYYIIKLIFYNNKVDIFFKKYSKNSNNN
jgi:hypothetical protein